MDSGWASVAAAVIALAGGTLFGGYLEARRASVRTKAEHEWQKEQLRLQWLRQDAVAGLEHVEALRLRRLYATRDFYLTTLTWPDRRPSVVEASRDVDRQLIGQRLAVRIDNWINNGSPDADVPGLVAQVIGVTQEREEAYLMQGLEPIMKALHESLGRGPS